MDPTRWERIQSVFYDAAGLPDAEREPYLATACGSDAELINEVRSMLLEDGARESLLDRGLPDVAYPLFGAPVKTLPVQEIGPYRLKEILGQGGMGVVCLAEREDTGARVAIKLLLHSAISAQRREGFGREIRTLARLRHPYIARLYDAGSLVDGTPWFVMEYVEGSRLTDYCRDRQPSTAERLRLFRAICDAVQYAYRQGIIHRDLKPSNIMVEPDGTPRLLDFGIARQLHDPEEAEQSVSGIRFGSAEYAAPEWIRDGIVGAYTDVYSLGVILYEILAGRLPDDPAENLPASLPAGHNARRDLDAICGKARQPDVALRYQSVEELTRDIDRYLKCQPLDARAGAWTYRASKFVRRNRRAVAATALTSAIVIGLVAFYTVRLAKARDAAQAEAARTKSIQQFMLNLFDGGQPETAPSNDLRALTILDRGVKQAAALKSDPETQAELYESLGSMYNMLANFTESDRLLLLALDKMKAAVGPGSPKVAEVLLKIAVERGDRSQLKEAVKYAQDALKLLEGHVPPGDLLVVEAKSVLGRVTAQSGSYQRAIDLLEPLVKVQPTGEEATYDYADNLLVIGVCYYSLGRFDTAESYDRRALKLHRQLAGDLHPRTANDLANLGQVKTAMAQYAEAEFYYRQAIRIISDWYGAGHPDTASMYGYLARTLLAERKFDEAETVLRGVLAIQEKAYGGPDIRIATTLDSLGKIAMERGDYATAQRDLSRGLAIATTLFGPSSYQAAVIGADLGELHLRQGQFEAGDSELGGAVRALSALWPPGDPHIGAVEIVWGRLLLREKRYPDAEKHLAAGYQSLVKLPHPPAKRMEEARTDLAAVYLALGQPEKAALYRTASLTVK